MDTTSVIAELEAALAAQLEVGAVNPETEAVGRAVLVALEPAVRRAALQLAEQAALEVDAQLPEATVEVALRDGEPMLMVRRDESAATKYQSDDLAARITVRLPEALKHELESAAESAGDSINGYVIKALATQSRRRNSRRIRETFET